MVIIINYAFIRYYIMYFILNNFHLFYLRFDKMLLSCFLNLFSHLLGLVFLVLILLMFSFFLIVMDSFRLMDCFVHFEILFLIGLRVNLRQTLYLIWIFAKFCLTQIDKFYFCLRQMEIHSLLENLYLLLFGLKCLSFRKVSFDVDLITVFS